MSVDEILSRRLIDGFAILVEPSPGGLWRCRIREAQGGWSSLRAGHPGFPTPLAAATDTDERLTELVESRVQVKATESFAALEKLVVEGRLIKREVPVPGSSAVRVEWAVLDERGVVVGDGPTVAAAARVEATRGRG